MFSCKSRDHLDRQYNVYARGQTIIAAAVLLSYLWAYIISMLKAGINASADLLWNRCSLKSCISDLKLSFISYKNLSKCQSINITGISQSPFMGTSNYSPYVLMFIVMYANILDCIATTRFYRIWYLWSNKLIHYDIDVISNWMHFLWSVASQFNRPATTPPKLTYFFFSPNWVGTFKSRVSWTSV